MNEYEKYSICCTYFKYEEVSYMDKAVYLEHLLAKYSGTFDIHKPYMVHGKEYPAYGYFFSCIEKYVLVREANLWTSNSYEHILFIEEEQCTQDTLNEVLSLIKDYMEPELVRKGQKEPEPNHMYSYLTVAVITDKKPEKSIRKSIRRLSFDKGYRFNLRGYCQGHLVVVSMEEEAVFTNRMGRRSEKLYKEVFKQLIR